MKKTLVIISILFLTFGLFAQSDDDLFGSSDDALFGSDDSDLFGDDDMFGDDSIVEVTDVAAKSDLSKGVIFDSGSIKVGGSLSAGITTNTILYEENGDDLGENIYRTKLSPDLSAMLSVDARPTETLRMYTKFGFAYPFVDTVTSTSYTSVESMLYPKNDIKPEDLVKNITVMQLLKDYGVYSYANTQTSSSVSDWFKLKELFTDFSYKDTAFFRFGIHTVTWGAGYFFSPVSDMINSSSIDPENPDKQVDGSLNLRTQIIIPNSQNCLWFYVIPSTNFKDQTADSYARDTALAGKADILLGGWELGIGGLYKYQTAPKAMLTATGSLKKMSFFGEFVYSYGAASEWLKNTDWNEKTSIFQATAGFSYYWKEPKINLAAQYYWESNEIDLAKKIGLYGHNLALMASKGDLFKNSNLSLTLFAMANFGHKDATVDDIIELYPQMELMATVMPEKLEEYAKQASSMPTLTTNLMLNYTPFKDVRLGAGPVITVKDFETNPTIAFKCTASLGGGKF